MLPMALPNKLHPRDSSASESWIPVGMNQGHAFFKVVPCQQPAVSVYGGAGGRGIHISPVNRKLDDFDFGFQNNGFSNELLLHNSEKHAMQNLNERLASYLEKVHALQKENSNFEVKIKEWFKKGSPITRKDYSAYHKKIMELQTKIITAQKANCNFEQQLDSNRRATQEIQKKYETEVILRQDVENDIARMKRNIDDLTLVRSNLEEKAESLQEQLARDTKEYEKELEDLCKQLIQTVDVELDSAPSVDLNWIMENMRKQYEIIAEKYRQEAKKQYEKQIEKLKKKQAFTDTEIGSLETRLEELRHNYNIHNTEYETECAMNWRREYNKDDAEVHHQSILVQIQANIRSIEEELWQLRRDMEQHNVSYNILLEIKVKLEEEIATYRRLLEWEDGRVRIPNVNEDEPDKVPVQRIKEEGKKTDVTEIKRRDEKGIEIEMDTNKIRKITMIVNEVVNGKIVATEVQEVEEKM